MKRLILSSFFGLAVLVLLSKPARADDVKADAKDKVADVKDDAKDKLHTDSGTDKAARHVKKGARHVEAGARHTKEDVQDSTKN